MNNQEKTRSLFRWTTNDAARMALVTSLYVVATIFLSVISFGIVQIRLSEMFNYLALYNKRYIWAVTLGVAIANLASPQGVIDVFVGSICTFLVLLFNYWLTKKVKDLRVKFIFTALIFAFSMFTVAGQLTLLYGAPFFMSWLTIGLGELLSMSVGGIIMYQLGKKMDFTK